MFLRACRYLFVWSVVYHVTDEFAFSVFKRDTIKQIIHLSFKVLTWAFTVVKSTTKDKQVLYQVKDAAGAAEFTVCDTWTGAHMSGSGDFSFGKWKLM